MSLIDKLEKKLMPHESPCVGCNHARGGLPPNVPVEEVEQYDETQIEHDYPCVPVDVKNIPSVRVLPARRANMLTYTLPGQGAVNSELVCGADPRIKRVYFTAGATAVWIGTETQIKAPNGPYGFKIPAGANSPGFEGVDENLWAVADSATSSVSVRVEYWAD